MRIFNTKRLNKIISLTIIILFLFSTLFLNINKVYAKDSASVGKPVTVGDYTFQYNPSDKTITMRFYNANFGKKGDDGNNVTVTFTNKRY